MCSLYLSILRYIEDPNDPYVAQYYIPMYSRTRLKIKYVKCSNADLSKLTLRYGPLDENHIKHRNKYLQWAKNKNSTTF